MNMKALVKKHTPVIDDICGVLHKHKVPQDEGEAILLWIAGLSAGHRGVDMLAENSTFIEPLATAYGYVMLRKASGKSPEDILQ